MTLIERTFIDQLKLHRTKTEGDPPPDWRRVERELIAFFESCGFHVSDVAAEPFVEIARWREPDEVVTAKCSLEILTKLLVEEIRR
jgi:hypothetical protein